MDKGSMRDKIMDKRWVFKFQYSEILLERVQTDFGLASPKRFSQVSKTLELYSEMCRGNLQLIYI